MAGSHDSHTLSPQSVLRIARRRAAVIIACIVLTPAAAYAFSSQQQKEYSASAALLFRDPGFDEKLFGSAVLPPSEDPAREAATNVRLVSLEAVATRTANRMGVVSGDVSGKVLVAAEGQSDVVSVTATDPNPRFAARLATTFAEEYINFRRQADRSKIAEAQELVERQIAELPPTEELRARSLQLRAEELEVLASLQTGNAELVERAEPPSSPSSPQTRRNTILGGVVGVILGFGLALLFERMDRRYRDPSELERVFDRPILATIPESRTMSKRKGPGLAPLPPQEEEAFRMLRANLRYFNVDQDVRSVLLTSAAPGDGKSTVAWQLAAAASTAPGARVLLIEADLRHPSLAQGLGVASDTRMGLSSVLAGQVELQDVISSVPVGAVQNGKEPRTIDVVFAGPMPPNPHDLIDSQRMQEVLATATHLYDLVVVDTPPTSVVSDAIPLVKQVDGVIVIGRLSKSTRPAVTQLRDQLVNLDAPVLGVVVNAVGKDTDAYQTGYGYGYGYYAKPERSKTRS